MTQCTSRNEEQYTKLYTHEDIYIYKPNYFYRFFFHFVCLYLWQERMNCKEIISISRFYSLRGSKVNSTSIPNRKEILSKTLSDLILSKPTSGLGDIFTNFNSCTRQKSERTSSGVNSKSYALSFNIHAMHIGDRRLACWNPGLIRAKLVQLKHQTCLFPP